MCTICFVIRLYLVILINIQASDETKLSHHKPNKSLGCLFYVPIVQGVAGALDDISSTSSTTQVIRKGRQGASYAIV
jgi:hypothetical protein